MKKLFKHLGNLCLQPFAWLYRSGVYFRNRFYDLNLLKSTEFDLPVISVGNITVGGTGKTPHIEYLLRIINDFKNTAVLSRGYKRKSKGYILATPDSSARQIGDEPYQIKKKYPDLLVAVDGDRVEGINKLLKELTPPSYILLDDAYQHRSIKPGLNIVLVEQRTIDEGDFMLPYGRLREPIANLDRADIIIVTKCKDTLRPVDFMTMRKRIDAYPYQKLYFSNYLYNTPHLVFPSESEGEIEKKGFEQEHHWLLLTGIANPQPLYDYWQGKGLSTQKMRFPDHHFYTPANYQKIEKVFHQLPEPRLILTTEKDAARLLTDEYFPEDLKAFIYQVDIEVEILNGLQVEFEEEILKYAKRGQKRPSI